MFGAENKQRLKSTTFRGSQAKMTRHWTKKEKKRGKESLMNLGFTLLFRELETIKHSESRCVELRGSMIVIT